MKPKLSRPKMGGPLKFGREARAVVVTRSAQSRRVCFWCDEPPTRRRPLFVHPTMPDGPMHRACAIVKLKLDPVTADAELQEVRNGT